MRLCAPLPPPRSQDGRAARPPPTPPRARARAAAAALAGAALALQGCGDSDDLQVRGQKDVVPGMRFTVRSSDTVLQVSSEDAPLCELTEGELQGRALASAASWWKQKMPPSSNAPKAECDPDGKFIATAQLTPGDDVREFIGSVMALTKQDLVMTGGVAPYGTGANWSLLGYQQLTGGGKVLGGFEHDHSKGGNGSGNVLLAATIPNLTACHLKVFGKHEELEKTQETAWKARAPSGFNVSAACEGHNFLVTAFAALDPKDAEKAFANYTSTVVAAENAGKIDPDRAKLSEIAEQANKDVQGPGALASTVALSWIPREPNGTDHGSGLVRVKLKNAAESPNASDVRQGLLPEGWDLHTSPDGDLQFSRDDVPRDDATAAFEGVASKLTTYRAPASLVERAPRARAASRWRRRGTLRRADRLGQILGTNP